MDERYHEATCDRALARAGATDDEVVPVAEELRHLRTAWAWAHDSSTTLPISARSTECVSKLIVQQKAEANARHACPGVRMAGVVNTAEARPARSIDCAGLCVAEPAGGPEAHRREQLQLGDAGDPQVLRNGRGGASLRRCFRQREHHAAGNAPSRLPPPPFCRFCIVDAAGSVG